VVSRGSEHVVGRGSERGPDILKLANARVVIPGAVLDQGSVEISHGRIAAVRAGTADSPQIPGADAIDLGGAWLVPGFIDLHVHGGGGHDFARSAADLAAGVAYHASRGTSRTLVSLAAAPVEAMCEQLSWVAAQSTASAGAESPVLGVESRVLGVESPVPGAESRVVGAHLEGPFLSAVRCGAQDPGQLLAPDPKVLQRLLEAGRGSVRSVTIAPELPGALELIGELVQGGAIAAIGHTDATYEQAMAGFKAGASLATHLFNAMGSFSQRAPGPAFAALDAGAAVELINDGVHVHSALVRLVASVDPANLVLVTDAISAAGVGDGDYLLGDSPVTVDGGKARLKGTDTLAGSTLTMDEAFRRAVVEVGLPIEVASAAASTNPARVLGLADRCGSIAVGQDADVVVLDGDLQVQRVMIGGRWV
jgi:N-acetylglucosamine-6-phosphate deacetylase